MGKSFFCKDRKKRGVFFMPCGAAQKLVLTGRHLEFICLVTARSRAILNIRLLSLESATRQRSCHTNELQNSK